MRAQAGNEDKPARYLGSEICLVSSSLRPVCGFQTGDARPTFVLIELQTQL